MAKPKILFVDDEKALWTLVRSTLESAGFETLFAENGQQALDLARAQRPDAIVLDVMMPEMDGYQTCRKLKDDPDLKDIPVIMLSASKDRKLNEKAFRAGAQLCMTKPFNAERLTNTIQIALRIKPA